MTPDSGMYSCWVTLCDGSECLKDPDRTSRTSNYFTDKDDVFVPSAIHFEIVYLHPDRTAVIPCRVTSPLDKVFLHREVPPEEMEVDETLVSYDPTKDFILQKPRPSHRSPQSPSCFTWRLVRHTTRIFQSVMAVDDLETIDFGRYICRAKKQHGEIAVATTVHSN
ncbi:platelet-derived growth factor receptor-like protein [Coregonus clupeaformis]|uniref:platelet-derived growth factor receptor-like protein n=1 Tax=Coregonus clupeaformis TaxID=59861 RepID=UPI001BE0C774|nr:platelet-derived growth factor receptor-like protein [Coregonus clupeaformis]